MRNKLRVLIYTGVLLGAGIASPAIAHETGDWLVRFGASDIEPKSDNHDVVAVDNAWGATINFSYMVTDNWAVELLAAYPYKHDIELKDGTKVGSTKHLPPTVSLQYHFLPAAKVQPYIGIGVNYTDFFSEKTTGPLDGTDLKLGSSWGLSGEIGVDIPFNDKWFFNLDVKYIDIETKAKLDGASLGDVAIDPWVYGVHVGFRF